MSSGPLTIKECITDFSNGYTGGNYSTLYTYFSSVGTSDYGAMKASTFWDTTDFTSALHPQALSGYTISGTAVTGPFLNDNYGSGAATISITMEQDGLYWYIKTLTVTPTGSGSASTTIS